ncbi:MAG: putative 2-aminoethylphosphonate ABC transporter ATP-binding protein [Desulfovibrionaceae bacterium]
MKRFAPQADEYLRVEAVTKRYGRFTALEEVGFSARAGELVCILGPSGCGKTTMLRVVAGLERQDSGRVLLDGRDVSALPVARRNVGIVFQSYALFPNLTAERNVAYGLTGKGVTAVGVRRRVRELLDLVGLGGMGNKFPAQLSGGQQQRVALARAMALSPDLLLLDEPLSALDAKVRIMLRTEIRQLQRRLGVTTVMVTHDQEEALTMADRILVMDRGRLVQDGTPHEIYDRPATPFVASFIGSMNFLENSVRRGEFFEAGGLSLRVAEGGHIPEGVRATVAIRPEDVLLSTNGATENVFTARVRDLEYRGASYRVRFLLPLSRRGEHLEAEIPTEKCRRLDLGRDKDVAIVLPPDRLRAYPQAS